MVNILIYGAGAIGSFAGYLLSESEGEGKPIENVALLGRESHIQRIAEEGLIVDLLGDQICLKFRHCFSNLEELKGSCFSPDIIIVCVKTCSLAGVSEEIIASGLLEANLKASDFLLLMNGMGNLERFPLPHSRIYEGITSFGVVAPSNGSIELRGFGRTIIEDGLTPKIKEFMKTRFEEKEFEIEFSCDFKKHQWVKLFVNSVINPITALTREQNGIVLSSDLDRTVEQIIEECVSIAKMEGIEADKEFVLDLVYSVAERTSMNTSSMLSDILRGKKTEIDSINGYVIELSRKHKIHAEINETLYALVKSIEGKVL